jgi:hypothetical protein
VAARLAEDRDRVAGELNERVVGRLFRVGLGMSGLASVLADASQPTAVLGYVEELDAAIGQIRSVIFERDGPNRDFPRPPGPDHDPNPNPNLDPRLCGMRQERCSDQ